MTTKQKTTKYRIRTMDLGIIKRISEYCLVHDIDYWTYDDGVNPYTIRFITDYDTYKKILFMNGLNEY